MHFTATFHISAKRTIYVLWNKIIKIIGHSRKKKVFNCAPGACHEKTHKKSFLTNWTLTLDLHFRAKEGFFHYGLTPWVWRMYVKPFRFAPLVHIFTNPPYTLSTEQYLKRTFFTPDLWPLTFNFCLQLAFLTINLCAEFQPCSSNGADLCCYCVDAHTHTHTHAGRNCHSTSCIWLRQMS